MKKKMMIYSFLMITLMLSIIKVQCNVANNTELEISKMLRRLVDPAVYNMDLRPYFGGPPVEVKVEVEVVSISSVNEINMDFTLEFYLLQEWRDPRLAFSPIGNHTELSVGDELIQKIWKPDTYVYNSKDEKHHVSASSGTRSTYLKLSFNGDIYYHNRLTVTASCPMDLKHFPADKQKCNIDLASYGLPTVDLDYHWRSNSSCILSPDIFLPHFIIVNHTQSRDMEYISTGNYSFLMCDIYFERVIGYYVYQIYIPAFLIVVISWIPFWLKRDHHARVGLGVTTVLTITTLTANTMSTLPKVSYIKAIDLYLFACFLMVFLSLVEYAIVGFFEAREDESQPPSMGSIDSCEKAASSVSVVEKTSKFDRHSRVVFPVVFLTFNLIYIGYIVFGIK